MKTHVIIPALIRVVGRARPDLHLCPVGVLAARDVQTFVAVGFDLAATAEGPFLAGRVRARLDGHLRAVGIGCGRQTLRWSGREFLSLNLCECARMDDVPLLMPGCKRSWPM
jgi:hypothetical protein